MEDDKSLTALNQLVRASEASLPTAPPSPNRLTSIIPPEGPTKENFEIMYDNFIRTFHDSDHCRVPDHINKFNDPPTYQKKTFCTFDLYQIVLECGGIHKLQKLPRQWTNTQPNMQPNPLPRNWTQVASQLGYDTKATNISFRIKEWLRFHHIDAFFDYLMNIPHEFFSKHEAHLDAQNGARNLMELESSGPRLLDTNVRNMQISLPPTSNIHTPHLMKRYALDRSSESSLTDSLGKKRSSDNIIFDNTMRKRSMSTGPDSEKDDEKYDQSQLINKLRNEISDLLSQIHRYEDHLGARDQRIMLLQQELDDKNKQLTRAAQFKEMMLRYLDCLPNQKPTV